MPRLLLLTAGDFGAAVAARLADRHPGSETLDVSAGTHLALWPALDALVLAADHDDAELVELVERAAFAWRRPWFPVLLEQAHLRCGPVVVPGRTACHQCFRRRRRQHAAQPAAWGDTPAPAIAGDRVRGYARHHVEIAAGLAAQAVDDAFAPTVEAPGGWVRTIGLADGAVTRAGVVAVDACARCRDAGARPARTSRLYAALQAALAQPVTG